jgi:Collagen triple helix repeat (20 copies)
MFSSIRKRLTYANVAMTLALVFAMSGGAYAAKHYLITSTKQISPKVLKQLKGAKGATGAAGAAGAAGAQGAQGLKGETGKGEKGEKGEKGDKGETGTAGTNGTTGFTKTLPKGETEKGDWSLTSTGTSGDVSTAVSFDIPLAQAPAVHLVKGVVMGPEAKGTGDLTIGSRTVTNVTGTFIAGSSISGAGIPAETFIPTAGSGTFELSNEATASGTSVPLTAPGPPAGCTGNVTNPGAEEGNLCVFPRDELSVASSGKICAPGSPPEGVTPIHCIVSSGDPNTADPFGFVIIASASSFIGYDGTWAVTEE